MNYQEFKNSIVKGLQDLYGNETMISIERILKNNGQYYDGLQIFPQSAKSITPIINMDEIYNEYKKTDMKMEDCIKRIYNCRKEYGCAEDIQQFACQLTDWEFVKGNVYPILLTTEDNWELLQNLVSVPILDLSIAYIIRGDGGKCVKISRAVMKKYRIDSKELHSQAMENMKKDSYRFQEINDLVRDMLGEMELTEAIPLQGELHPGKMYVLTNAANLYGAAGILDKKLIKEFAGNRNFFILPSSIHETIFIPAADEEDGKKFNKMVAQINESTVAQEERLSDHCYYYDAQRDEIRKWD